MAGETKTGGRPASTGVIRGRFALSVGKPADTPPPEWTWVALTDVARLETGHTPSRKHAEYWGGDVPWIGIRDATRNHGSVIFDTEQHTNELGIANSSARVLPANTVCLSRTASVGYVVVMGRPMATSQDFVNWVCSNKIDHRFLSYVLLAEHDSFLRFASGTTHQTIYFPEVKAFHVCLPPLAEQQAIACILGALDEKINLNTRRNRTLERMARELFRSWFVDFDPVKAKVNGHTPSGMKPAIAAHFPDRFEDSHLGPIPNGWQTRMLGEVLDVKHGFAFAGEYFCQEPTRDILLTPGNFEVGGGFKDDKYKYYDGPVPAEFVLDRDDLLLTMTDLSKSADTLGYPAFIPSPPTGTRYLHNQRLGKVVITETESVNALFLYQVFCGDGYRQEILASATGTTVKHTAPTRIKAFKTVFPSAPLVREFKEIAKPWHLRLTLNRDESRTLAALRDTLLPRLISGELRVSDAERIVGRAV